MKAHAIGVDIGGTKIAAGIVAGDGRLTERYVLPTSSTQGAAAVLETALEAARQVLAVALASGIPILAAGVGAAGHIDHERGVVTYAANTLPGWAGIDIRTAMKNALNLPVTVDNDVNTMALGEQYIGAGRPF